jgi:hypothetical protein
MRVITTLIDRCASLLTTFTDFRGSTVALLAVRPRRMDDRSVVTTIDGEAFTKAWLTAVEAVDSTRTSALGL